MSAFMEPPSAPPPKKMASQTPNAVGGRRPVNQVNRDRVLQPTTAPPGARQQYQLHRARESSRDLELRSSLWGGYVRWSRIQSIGSEKSRLQFDRMTREQKARLKEPMRWLRAEWERYQSMRGIGGAGQTVHQLLGQTLHHWLVDGDCFLLPRRENGLRVWDLYPGDALAEQQYSASWGSTGSSGGRNILLGIETDRYNKPLNFHFGVGRSISRLNWGYWSYGSASSDIDIIPAKRVVHVRDRSGESTAVRGWPRCTQVLEDIPRIDEWYDALARSAVLRASISLALKRAEFYGDPNTLGDGGNVSQFAARSLGSQTELTTEQGDATESQDVARYQEFSANAGSVMELDPGYDVTEIGTGSPTSQEAMAMQMLERHVCSALRATPATLLGDYKGISFSGGQLQHIQERQGIEDQQMVLTMQALGPIYRDAVVSRWQRMVELFSEIEPSDMEAFLYPNIRLRRYQVLDRSKIAKPIIEMWSAGAITYPEMREELGFWGFDVEAVIEEWKENRKMLGLSESPQASNPSDDDDDQGDDDGGDKKEGGDEDD